MPAPNSRDVLTDILRAGAQRLLTQAIEDEVTDWIESRANLTNEAGHRQVVRNGRLPKRAILTGLGPIEVEQPRVLDRRPKDEAEPFSSKVLPPYLRKTKSLKEDRLCILVLMGATADGRKELIAVTDGYRESEQSWNALLLDAKARGLVVDPKLATGDGALGFWKALPQVYPSTREQRCWVHKTANVLDKLPKRLQSEAKDKIHQIWMAPTKVDADKAFDLFVATYEAKYPQATACLSKDRDVLLTFYDFPAEHWIHLRTTNPIESTFATVRLRHRRTKGNGSRLACLTMVFKLMQSAQKRWRLLNGSNMLRDVIQGTPFIDGIKPQQTAA